MNFKEAEQMVKEVFGADTKAFCREDPIAGSKKVLRPLRDDEDADALKGRVLTGEGLLILGQGKTWEDACRMALAPELMRRQEAARLRAAYANHEGELFSVFLRELYSEQFETWKKESPLAQGMQKEFDDMIAEAQKAGNAGPVRA